MTLPLEPKALVITGDGINCERETAQALELARFNVEIRHINDLITEQVTVDVLNRLYSVLVLPGGFSFGDDIASGKILALKVVHELRWDLNQFVARGGLFLGVCNGFQALIRMGIFGKDISITKNASGKFIDQWVKCQPVGSKSIWLKGLGTLDLPIRHGEGRILLGRTTRIETMVKFERHQMICLKYELNPNGSEESIAGLSDPTGRILGLMPHPEGAVRATQLPEWTLYPDRAASPGPGLQLFENAYHEAKGSMG